MEVSSIRSCKRQRTRGELDFISQRMSSTQELTLVALRMHLLTFMKIKQPSAFFRLMVLGAQGVFFNLFFVAALLCKSTTTLSAP
jgi:hypothetical protein